MKAEGWSVSRGRRSVPLPVRDSDENKSGTAVRDVKIRTVLSIENTKLIHLMPMILNESMDYAGH